MYEIPVGLMCQQCGVLISNAGKHREWHDGNDEAVALLRRAAEHFGVSTEALRTSRMRKPMLARSVAAYIMRAKGMTWQAISRYLRRDHSTCIVAVRRIEADRGRYADVDEALRALGAT